MNITQVSNPQANWTTSPRTLTGFGSAIIPTNASITLTLSAGAIATFLSPAGTMEMVTIVGVGLANVGWSIGLSNGTTFRIGVSANAPSPLMATMVSTPTVGAALQNFGSIAGTYAITIMEFVQ